MRVTRFQYTQVNMRLRVLGKRAKTRKDRIVALEVEKKGFTSQESSLKVLVYPNIIAPSI